LSEWEHGLQKIEILNFQRNKRLASISEPVYSASLAQNRESRPASALQLPVAVTPIRVFDYDMNTGKATRLKETEVPGGFNKKTTSRSVSLLSASDGTRIPLSVVITRNHSSTARRRCSLRLRSYGVSIPPSFNSNRLSLLTAASFTVHRALFAAAVSWAKSGATPGA